MVLHLLGKKSWNVYNTDNVDRVRRDEAAAAAKEEERERLMQEQDSLRRTAILRGEDPPTFAPLSPSPSPSDAKRPRRDDGLATSADRKQRRRLRDEDETSYAIRMAKLDANVADTARDTISNQDQNTTHDKNHVAPIVDHAGHIQLFAPPDEVAIRRQHIDDEKESRKKEREMRAQGFQDNLRMANAGGYNNKPSTAPWYAKQSSHRQTSHPTQGDDQVETKDVWGRPDPRRKERDDARISSNDPFTFMQQAQKQLSQVEHERAVWRANKEKETKELEKMQKDARRAEREERRRSSKHIRHHHHSSSSSHHRRHHRRDDEREDEKTSSSRQRRHRRESVESLDNFSLDTVPPPAVTDRENGDREERRNRNDHHHHHRKDYRERRDQKRHKSRSRSKSPRRYDHSGNSHDHHHRSSRSS